MAATRPPKLATPPEALNTLQQQLDSAPCPTPAYLSTLAEQSAFAAGVAAMRRQALAVTASPKLAMPVELSMAMGEAWASAEYTFTHPGEDHPGMKYVRQHQYRAMRNALLADRAARSAAGEQLSDDATLLAMPDEITDRMAEAWRAAKYTFTYSGEDHPGMRYVWEHQYRAMRDVAAKDAERAQKRHLRKMRAQQEAREHANELAEHALQELGLDPESMKLFAGIHANRHAFTAEAAHKAFAGVRRRALPTLPPPLKIESSRELGVLFDNLRKAGNMNTDQKGHLAARRELLNFIRQLMHDYAHLALVSREAELAAATAVKAPDPS